MARPTRSDYAALTARVAKILDSVSLERLEYNSQRVLWEVQGTYRGYYVQLKEIHSTQGRMYSYYVIRAGEVRVGYDNYPDRQALSARYGTAFTSHLNELIPHRHGERKETMELTPAMTAEDFLAVLLQLTQ